MRTIESHVHSEIKKMFWFLFVESRGDNSRIRIISVPRNRCKLSAELDLDYKSRWMEQKLKDQNHTVFFIDPVEQIELIFV